MGSEYAVEMKNITKRFGGLIAVDNVSLQIKSGEIHALCGENGAGKSTLMNVLTGKFPPNEGEIYLKGEKKKIHNPKDARNEKITIVHQELELIPDLSIAENIFLGNQPKTPSGVDWKKMYSEAEEILKKFSLNLNVKTKIKYLTVGQQQLVEIAKAIYLGGNVLILDEPTAPLTGREIDFLLNMLENLKKTDISIIYITHRLEEVFKIADRASVMRDGKMIETFDIKDITVDQLVSTMVGRKMDRVKRDVPFYEASGGGVTLSGGEPMVRPEFAYALLRTLTERWIDTAIETCGYAKTEDYEQIVPYLNTIFMDLKHMNSEKHKQWTGHGNELILMNIKRVNDMIPVYGNRMFIRIPIIPGFNDKPEEVEETAAFVAKNCTNITGMELLPYHKLGRGKYYSLGREYEMESTVPPTTEKMNELNEILNKYDIPIFKF